jgi:hypothetical protein
MSNGGIFRYGMPNGRSSGCSSDRSFDHSFNRSSDYHSGRNSFRSSALAVLLTIGSTIAGYAAPVRAESPDSAPEEVLATNDRLETAANSRDLTNLMDLYASNFEHDDGFNRRDLRSAIVEFWDRYETLNYEVELLDWEATGTGYITETEITITGRTTGDRPYQLASAMRSRQTFVNDRLVQQTTLEEASTLSAGEAPPTVRIQLPDGVAPGDRFEFDAIVLEPLGDNFLLGGVLEESVDLAIDRDPAFIELQPLNAGGLFKIGTAPAESRDLWISGAIVRKDGITIVTQRLPVSSAATR